MVQRAAFIPATDRDLLNEAGASIPRLYHNQGKPQDALLWEEKLKVARH